MAKKDSLSKINKSLDNVESRLNDMYQKTYYTTNSDKKMLDTLNTDIENKLNNIISNNSDLQGISNISRLYSRLETKSRGEEGYSSLLDPNSDKANNRSLDNDLLSMFSDNNISANIMETYSQNKWIMAMDQEIDTILKYMPKLAEALDIKKDNIISADNFSKDFINVKKEMDDEGSKVFNNRIDEIKEKYKLLELFEDMIDETQRRGEYFLYIVPYKKAFEKLLSIRSQSGGMSIKEFAVDRDSNNELILEDTVEITAESSDFGPSLFIHKTGMLENVINNFSKAEKSLKGLNESINGQGLYESYLNEAADDNSKKKSTKKEKIKFDNIINDTLEFPADDGLFTSDERKTNERKVGRITVPGAVIKKLERSRLIPIYIENICLGYYHVEAMPLMGDPNRYSIGGIYDTQLSHDPNSPNSPESSSSNLLSAIQAQNGENDMFLKQLAHTISEKIDSQFINANQDLSREIYMILKYDETFNQGYVKTNVTFIPADDIIHFKFKTDPVTHRGVSDLYNSLVPAKMWAMLNLCTTMGILTRGQDKRVYYVKQTVETNVAKSLMNVVNQIKKGNFGVRQMESINNILNIVGKFNDYVIPVGQSGDSPINFEVMQGQQFDTQDNLMDRLEDASISATGIPLELVQTLHNSIDYAIQLTMSNSKFLRTVFKRQSIAEKFFSIIMTKIYNCEYEETETITMSLPSPAFLSLANNSQLINNAKEYVASIVEFECDNEEDDVKAGLTKKLMRYHLNTHINTTMIDKLKDEVKLELSVEKKGNQEQ